MLAEWIVRIATATIIAGSVTYYAPRRDGAGLHQPA